MIGVRAAMGVDVLNIEDIPSGFPWLQENIVQPMTEEGATPGPTEFMGCGMSVLVDLAKCILPVGTDVLNLMSMLRGIEVPGDNGRLP